jgi:LacI family transcriptional regulator
VPTMKDVARLAGVSTATVSAVINETSYVSEGLKDRVRQAIARLNYSPSGVARSLRTRTTRLVGLIIADITNPFFTELVRCIGAEVQTLGYTMLLNETNHDAEQEVAAMQLLAAHGVDGVILAATGPSDMYFRPPIADFPRPVVMVDRAVPDAPFDSVSIDNRRASFEVTRHILELGHREIAIVAGARHLPNTADRLAGFRDALVAAGIALEPDRIVYADFREDRSYELCRNLLARRNRPTALFVSNNQMVFGAMHAIKDLGLACPSDISVAAIDDLPGADIFAPRLTVQRQPIADIAHEAVRLVMARMRSGSLTPPERVVLPTCLIVRDSCAPTSRSGGSRQRRATRALTRPGVRETIS